MAGQSIRRSQFITTYGPGAILEGRGGPRVIMALDLANIFSATRPVTRFEITDWRLSTALLGGAGIVRLPTNAELGVPDTYEVYETTPFPTWALCTQHQILYQKRPGTLPLQACPSCAALRNAPEAWARARRQAIRFVQVCPDGHLDDVNWMSIVTHRRPGCAPQYLRWSGSGTALRNIDIVCPDCGGRINLGFAYGQSWPCSGRFPERGNARLGCDKQAKIYQRGAANIRMPELYSALTIPPADTRLSRLLEISIIRAIILTNPIASKQDLLQKVGALVSASLLGQGVMTELGRFSEAEILAAIKQMQPGSLPQDNRQMRAQELEALRRAAVTGAPALPSSTPGAPPQFEVVRSDVREFPGPNGHRLRVTPVSRLRVVMVQKGYRRVDPLTSAVVEVAYVDSVDAQRRWFPGVELYGEGIFIDLAPDDLVAGQHFPLQSTSAHTAWLDAWRNPGGFGQVIRDPVEADFLHPVFVWWHTFAHRLINALSIDSGYSSAAVRERVFVAIDPQSGAASGGILLYTSQPGGDGTLGGMIALVPNFDRIIDTALRTIDACSNDPLCGEETFRANKYNGAACYACQLVSETSCEHRNTRLDRTLLAENLP